MKLLIAVSGVLLFVLIPLGLLIVSGKAYGRGINLPILILKLLLAGITHLGATILVIFMLMFMVIGPDPHRGSRLEFGEESKVICSLAIAGYGFIGWLLCSFVNGKFITSHSDFVSFSEKPQSIIAR